VKFWIKFHAEGRKRIRLFGALPAEYRGCSTKVESLGDSNGLTAFVFCDIASIHLMRLPLLSKKKNARNFGENFVHVV